MRSNIVRTESLKNCYRLILHDKWQYDYAYCSMTSGEHS